MAKYTIRARLLIDKLSSGKLNIRSTPFGHGRPLPGIDQDAAAIYFGCCNEAIRLGWQVCYIYGHEILSVNGVAVPKDFIVHDCTEDLRLGGDSVFIRAGLTVEDFIIEIVE